MQKNLKLIIYTTLISLATCALIFTIIARKAVVAAIFGNSADNGGVNITATGTQSNTANYSATNSSNTSNTATAKPSTKTKAS